MPLLVLKFGYVLMSKEIQLTRRLLKLERNYRKTVIELGRYYAKQKHQELANDEEAYHFGAGVYSGLREQVEGNRHV